MLHHTLEGIKPNMYIAVAPKTSQFSRIYVALVNRVYRDQQQVDVTLLWVPPGQRTGPWQARQWSIWTDEHGQPRKEVVSHGEIVCVVELCDSALTHESLERLTLHGVPASEQPRRDSTLPARRAD